MVERGKGWEMHLGDCLDVMPTLGKVDAVVTDPPYGIGFAAQPTKWQRRAGAVPHAWDDATCEDVARIIEGFSEAIVWGGNYYPLRPSRGWLCWIKPDAPPSMSSFELAWTSYDMICRSMSCSISQTNPERIGHPTQKPLKVMLWSVGWLTASAQTILDPFAGSGTTGVACLRLGRKFIGIEKDPTYFELAVERLRAEENGSTLQAARAGQEALFKG